MNPVSTPDDEQGATEGGSNKLLEMAVILMVTVLISTMQVVPVICTPFLHFDTSCFLLSALLMSNLLTLVFCSSWDRVVELSNTSLGVMVCFLASFVAFSCLWLILPLSFVWRISGDKLGFRRDTLNTNIGLYFFQGVLFFLSYWLFLKNKTTQTT